MISSLIFFLPFTTTAMKRTSHIHQAHSQFMHVCISFCPNKSPVNYISEEKLTTRWLKISQDPTVVTKLWPEPGRPNSRVILLLLLSLGIGDTGNQHRGMLKLLWTTSPDSENSVKCLSSASTASVQEAYSHQVKHTSLTPKCHWQP